MRFQRTDRFDADYRRLSQRDRDAFRTAVRAFAAACDVVIERRDPSAWPAALRVKAVRGAPGVWEMTWSFARPDGRATWEWAMVEVDGVRHPAVRWRRLGDHRALRES